MPSDLEPAAQPVAPLLLDVEGMKCGGCVRSVEQRLLAQPGVRQASVNLLNRTAWVGLDPQAITAEPAQPLSRPWPPWAIRPLYAIWMVTIGP